MNENQCPYFEGVEEKAGKYRISCGQQHTLEIAELNKYRIQSAQCVGGKMELCRPYLFRELKKIDPDLLKSDMGTPELHRIWLQKIAEGKQKMVKQETDLLQKDFVEANSGGAGAHTELAAELAGLSARRAKAIELHEGIRADVRVVAQGLSDIGRKLKKMRDEKLYTELGHETFADYGKAMLGLEQRQLYSYIQIFETYGPRFIDEHAELGISKLLLLTNVPAPEREDFVAENDLKNLTVRQLKEMTEKYNQAAEQLTLIGAEKESTEQQNERANRENGNLLKRIEAEKTAAEELTHTLEQERKRYRETENTLRRQLKEMENSPIEVAVQEPDEKTLEKIRSEAKKAAAVEIRKAKDEADNKIKAAEDKAAADIAEALERAGTAAAAQIKASLTSIEREKAEALERAAELEKKLTLAANSEIVQLNILFEQMLELAEKAGRCIERVAAEDAAKAEKLRAAAHCTIESLKERV